MTGNTSEESETVFVGVVSVSVLFCGKTVVRCIPWLSGPLPTSCTSGHESELSKVPMLTFNQQHNSCKSSS